MSLVFLEDISSVLGCCQCLSTVCGRTESTNETLLQCRIKRNSSSIAHKDTSSFEMILAPVLLSVISEGTVVLFKP